MERSKSCKRVCILLLLYSAITATFFLHCDARRAMHLLKVAKAHTKRLKMTKHFDLASLLLQKETMEPSNSAPYVSSPFSLPPFDSLPPIQNAPPYCTFPPNTPQTPSSIGYSPSPPYLLPPFLPFPGPPPSPTGGLPSPNPPTIVVSPPVFVPSPFVPTPPTVSPNPPEFGPSPPTYVPSPPTYVPSPQGPILSPPYYGLSPPTSIPYPSPPTGFNPNPPVFQPPVVFPPPAVPPPPPRTNPLSAVWCVAKPAVPDPIVQEAMNYACGSGADCASIQPSGSCFEPNNLFSHASYAFNSYWQRTKVAGGTCSFGGAAILVTVDPSYDGCHFMYF